MTCRVLLKPSRVPWWRLCVVIGLAGSSFVGCSWFQSDSGERENGAKDQAQPRPVSNDLPPLELRDDTKDLLLTWIDEHGDFHVVQKPADVPEAHRAQVRVVVTTKLEGTERVVYVADLRTQQPDGTYRVTTMTRAQWNELGAERRKVRLEAVLKPKPPASTTSDGKAIGVVEATIYGADWCKPCHDAEKYLKSLGVKVTKKDIEKSRTAQAEMQQKLAKANRAGASIPVIDVMGQLFVGFSPPALKRAVEAASKPQTL